MLWCCNKVLQLLIGLAKSVHFLLTLEVEKVRAGKFLYSQAQTEEGSVLKCDTLNNQDKEKQNMVNCALILNTSAQKLHILLPLTSLLEEKMPTRTGGLGYTRTERTSPRYSKLLPFPISTLWENGKGENSATVSDVCLLI